MNNRHIDTLNMTVTGFTFNQLFQLLMLGARARQLLKEGTFLISFEVRKDCPTGNTCCGDAVGVDGVLRSFGENQRDRYEVHVTAWWEDGVAKMGLYINHFYSTRIEESRWSREVEAKICDGDQFDLGDLSWLKSNWEETCEVRG